MRQSVVSGRIPGETVQLTTHVLTILKAILGSMRATLPSFSVLQGEILQIPLVRVVLIHIFNHRGHEGLELTFATFASLAGK